MDTLKYYKRNWFAYFIAILVLTAIGIIIEYIFDFELHWVYYSISGLVISITMPFILDKIETIRIRKFKLYLNNLNPPSDCVPHPIDGEIEVYTSERKIVIQYGPLKKMIHRYKLQTDKQYKREMKLKNILK